MMDNENNNICEEINENSQTKEIKLKALKIISVVCYAIVSAFLVYLLLSVVINPGTNYNLAVGVCLIFGLVFGGIGYLVTLIPTIIGLIISIVKREKGCTKKTRVFFIIFTILPFISEGLFLLICKLLVK